MVPQAVHAYRSAYSPGRWLVGDSASASGARVVPGYLRTSRPEQIGHVVGAAMRRATLAARRTVACVPGGRAAGRGAAPAPVAAVRSAPRDCAPWRAKPRAAAPA